MHKAFDSNLHLKQTPLADGVGCEMHKSLESLVIIRSPAERVRITRTNNER